MRLNHFLAIIFGAVGLLLALDLGLNFISVTGVVIGKQSHTAGSNKGGIQRYELLLKTASGVERVSIDPATYLEVTPGSRVSAYSSAVFGRTARIEFNGKTRDTTLSQTGTAVSIGLLVCFILCLGCLTLPIPARTTRRS